MTSVENRTDLNVGCLDTKYEKSQVVKFFLLISFSYTTRHIMAGRGRARAAPGEYVHLPSNAAADVDAYFEYRA